MSNAPNWLEDVIVVNESSDPTIAGDVQIYRNQADVGRKLEHWYVGEVEHLALTGAGHKVRLGLQDKVVVVDRVAPFAEGPAILSAWLKASAQHLHSLRTRRARKRKDGLGSLEAQGALPDIVEGLIAYVGFIK